MHVGYNPWTGWTYGVSWSNGFFRMGVIWSGGYHRGNTVINTGDINIGNTINAGNRAKVRSNIDRSNNRDLDGLSKNIYNRDGNVARRVWIQSVVATPKHPCLRRAGVSPFAYGDAEPLPIAR